MHSNIWNEDIDNGDLKSRRFSDASYQRQLISDAEFAEDPQQKLRHQTQGSLTRVTDKGDANSATVNLSKTNEFILKNDEETVEAIRWEAASWLSEVHPEITIYSATVGLEISEKVKKAWLEQFLDQKGYEEMLKREKEIKAAK